MNRLGLKALCLVIAIVIWIQVASNTTVQEQLQLPLEFVGQTDSTTLAGNSLPRAVRVRLRGSKLRMLTHSYLGQPAGRVVVNLQDFPLGQDTTYTLRLAEVRTSMQAEQIIDPTFLRFQLGREIARRVPVRVQASGSLPENRAFLVPPSTEPDSITLTGPQRFFTGEEVVLTKPVDLSRLKESTSLARALEELPPNLVSDIAEVRVDILVAPLKTRTFPNIPIRILLDAGQPGASVYPEAADVVLRGPADSVQAMVQARIHVVISLTDLGEGTHPVTGQVVALPECVGLVSLEPEQFLAIIGEVPVDSEEIEQR